MLKKNATSGIKPYVVMQNEKNVNKTFSQIVKRNESKDLNCWGNLHNNKGK